MPDPLTIEELVGGGVLQAQFGFVVKFWLSTGPVITLWCNFELQPGGVVLDPTRPETCGKALGVLHKVVEHASVKEDLLALSFSDGSQLSAKSETLAPGWTVELSDGTAVIPVRRQPA